MRRDEERSARLLFARELGAGLVDPSDFDRPEVRRGVTSQRVPSPIGRAAQRAAMRRGSLTWERFSLEPMLAARRAVLGDRAGGAPRLLIRVDEFPHVNVLARPEVGVEAYRHFHGLMGGAPYLLAVMAAVANGPFDPTEVGERPLDADEIGLLHELAGEGVTFGQHGYNHRTRHRSPRNHSELAGLRRKALEQLLQRGGDRLAEVGVHPHVFVPPYNRFDLRQYDALAARFAVVCGGPESVFRMGFHATPLWRGEAVYLPAYEPLYGRAAEVLPAVERLIEADAAVWAPVVLHWGWEAREEWSDLERLMSRVAPYAASWEEFLDAVAASR
jgi:peptidoglycan/xylan/chitin deacetylase (PgdA/CDA1 family)